MNILKYIGFVFLLLFSLNVVNADLITGIQNYWTFDNSSGVVDVIAGRSTTVVGAVFNSSGLINGARTYDGVTDYIETTDGTYQTSWSYSVWARTPSVTQAAAGYIIGQTAGGNFFNILLSASSNTIKAQVFGNSNSIDFNINISTWYHFVLTKDTSNDVRFYVNGNLIGTEPNAVSVLNPSGKLTFGRGSSTGGELEGTIDEIGFWNGVTLNSSLVLELYNNGIGCQYDFTNCNPIIASLNFTNVSIAGIEDFNNTFYNTTPQLLEVTLESNTNNNTNVTFRMYNATNNLIQTNQFITNDITGSFNISFPSEGAFKFYLFAQNNETNATVGNFTISFDVTPPVIINNIAVGYDKYTIPGFNSTCSDIDGGFCNISLDGQNVLLNTSTFTFNQNGNISYNITAQDGAGNTVIENGVIFVNPFQIFEFKNLITNVTITDYTFGGFPSNGSVTRIQIYDLGLGNHALTFIKAGFFQTDFNVTFNLTSDLNETFFIQPVTLTMFMFNSSNPSEQVFFNVTILNSTTSSVFTNQFNFSKQFSEIPTGNITIIITSTGFAEARFFNTISPFTSILINGFLIPDSVFSIITFKTLEFGSSDPVQDVLIEAQQLINGTFITISQGNTDATGQTFMNLDALVSYKFIFTKDGFVTATINAIPGTLDYTIRLRFSIEEFSFADGVGYQFLPSNVLLFIPDNFTFSGLVSGTSISLSTFTLTDQNGFVLFTDSSTNPTGTTFSTIIELLNTTNITTITSTITYVKDSTTTTVNKLYTVTSLTNTSFIGVAQNYGLNTDEESQLTRWFMMVIGLSAGLVAGRLLNLNATGSGLLMIPIAGFFMFIGWMPLSYFSVLAAGSLFFFIGGSAITR